MMDIGNAYVSGSRVLDQKTSGGFRCMVRLGLPLWNIICRQLVTVNFQNVECPTYRER